MRPLHTIGLALAALVLAPAVAFVAYEVTMLSENERLMASVYDRQLEALLFSVNQHTWDVAETWADRLETLDGTADPDAAARTAFARTSTVVRATFRADSVGRISTVAPPLAAPLPDLGPERAARLIAQRRAGYRGLSPIQTEAGALLLVFAGSPERAAGLAGLVVDADAFAEQIVVPKIKEVGRARFRIGLFRQGRDEPVHTAGTADSTFRRSEATQTKPLWALPGHVLAIAPEGTTVAALVQARFRRNLALAAGLVLLLLGAAGLVYRSIRRQMQLAKMKSDFVSNVSHELRTPLALIRMYAETLELGRVTAADRRREYYRIISQETERLTHLVNNLLNFSRVEAGRKTYHFVPVDLNTLAEEVAAHYGPALERDGFTFETDLDPALPAVQADRDALAEALINLVDNAAKYSRTERAVRLSTRREGATATVAVADRGIGIAPGERERIFEQFYRVESALVQTTQGTGLGLSLVRHIAEAHGGRIEVESRPGAGSTFTLRLPLAPAPEPALAATT